MCFGTKSGEFGGASLKDEAGEVIISGETGEDATSGVLTGVTDLLEREHLYRFAHVSFCCKITSSLDLALLSDLSSWISSQSWSQSL